MFGSTNPFGQSSTSPFGQNSFGTQQGFGQATPAASNPFAPKPFGSPTTTFGAQTGSSLFGTTSTGAFGQQQSTPTFGTTSTAAFGQQQSTPTFGTPSSSLFGSSPAFGASPTPAFGATSSTFGSGSLFGQKPSFGGFGSSPSQSSPFGSTFQQTQPTFGSSTFGTSTTPTFGTTTTPAFGVTTPAFGTTTTPAFGATTTPAFGSTAPSLFGASSTPAFGSSAPGFGTSATTAFGFPLVVLPLEQHHLSVQTPAFGSQTAAPAFGQAQFGNQAGGTRIKPYAQTPDVDGTTSGTQPAAKLDSISAMPEYKDKSHEELRWEDYQRGDKGGPNPSGTPTVTPTFPSSTPPNTFTTSSLFSQTTPNPFSSNNPFAKNGSTSASLFNTSFNNTPVASSSPFTSSTSTTMFGQTGVSAFPAVVHHLCFQILLLLLLHLRCLAHQQHVIQVYSALACCWLTLNQPHYFNLPLHLHNSHRVHQLSPLETYLAHLILAVCLAADLHFLQCQHFNNLPLLKHQTCSPSNLRLNQLLQVDFLVFPTQLIRPSLDRKLLANPIWSCNLLLFRIHLGHFQQCLRCPLGMVDDLLRFSMEYQVCQPPPPPPPTHTHTPTTFSL
ncbi:nuclear pore complex protein NUP98A-like isoform X1 [Panicum hallii]|uniref:nuclear pore complex protein NUP98A-like isoform X1 n=1 Tax=Panicum hallii TaxID=206008 RepID=UPI000DF4DE58|nr:nuclear pore complex protein NUP98A-like isoform X1 [Panicum hallii]